MRTFPDIHPAPADYSIWWYLAIPAAVLLVGLLIEAVVRVVNRRKNDALYYGRGVGIAMGMVGAVAGLLMSTMFIPQAITAEEDAAMVQALEEIGFQEIRINFEEGTFGAYYEGELMRGVVVENATRPGFYKVVETPPPLEITG